MARVLLLAPRVTGVRGGINRLQPSLGLGYLAAVLERDGHFPSVLDAALAGTEQEAPLEGSAVRIGLTDEQLGRRIAEARPDVVGVSVPFSNLADEALCIAALAKAACPSAPVVVGGNHVNGVVIDFEHGLTDGLERLLGPGVDFAMSGECDEEFSRLVTALEQGTALVGIAGLARRIGDRVVPPTSRPVVDFAALPHPARHLMDLEGYFRYGRFHSAKSTSPRVLNVMASRGCPERCSFCSTPTIWGSRLRWRDPADVALEITRCREAYRIEEVQLEDDSLSADAARLEALCDHLAPLGLPWCTPNGMKANYHPAKQADLFRKMKASGCYQVTLACESGVQRVLDEVIGKRLRVDQVAPAVAAAREAGLFVHTFWMLGFPGETRAEMDQTVAVAEACGADSYSFAIVTPLPGTPLYRKVRAERLGWDDARTGGSLNYRRSVVRVDGFEAPEPFERWVESLNERVNASAVQRDPERARRRAGLVHDPALASSKAKQT